MGCWGSNAISKDNGKEIFVKAEMFQAEATVIFQGNEVLLVNFHLSSAVP